MNYMIFNLPAIELSDAEIETIRSGFDPNFYLAANSDVRQSGIDPVDHYILYGEDEGRLPTPNFSPDRYRHRYPRSAAQAKNLFLHFLSAGRAMGYLATPPRCCTQPEQKDRDAELELVRQSFDTEYYLEINPDVAAAKIDPVAHYLAHGEIEGRRPETDFDPVFYRDENPDLKDAPFNLYWHYLQFGRAEGREGRGNFAAELDPENDTLLLATLLRTHVSKEFYYATYPDIAAAGIDPVGHYIQHGEREGRLPNSDFDPVTYRSANPALAEATCNLLWHHLSCAQCGNFLPSYVSAPAAARFADEVDAIVPHFDEAFYLDQCPEAHRSNVRPIVHYLAIGDAAGLWPHPDFNPDFYRQTNPDLIGQKKTAFWHYCAHGKAEMRTPCAYHETNGPPTFRVTAIIPNYNHARFLEERVNSIVEQTYDYIDIIILDDCSTDESTEIIRRIAANCARPVEVHFNEANSGNVFAQWRKGIDLAKSDLIWICESDDFCEPDFVENMVRHFKDLSVTMAFGQIQFCDQNGVFLPGMDDFRISAEPLDWQNTIKRPAYEWFSNALGTRNVMANVGGCMFRRQTLPDTLWATACEFRIIGDWYLYSRIAGGGQIVYEPGSIAYFRQHETNTSSSNFTQEYYYREYGMFMKKLCEYWDIPEATRRNFINFVRLEFSHFQMEERGYSLEQLVDIPGILNTSPQNNHIQLGFLGFRSGGGEVFPIVLANLLSQHGLTVSMIAHNLIDTVDEMYNSLNSGIPVYNISDMIITGRDTYINKCGINLIHSHINAIDSFFFSNIINQLHIPYVVTLHGSHDFLDTNDPNVTEYIGILINHVSVFVYTADKNLQMFLQAKPPAERIRKISNAMPRDDTPFTKSRSDMGIASDAVVFTFVARGIERKGWRVAVIAFQALRSAHPETPMHLLLVGDGEKTAVAEQLVSDDAKDSITFLGYQSRVNGIYALSDCAILPTRYPGESNPLCLIQAAQERLPIIAADVGEIANMLELDGEPGGILVSVKRDTEKFAMNFTAEMEKMLDPSIRMNFSRASEKIAVKYCTDHMLDLYLDAYQNAHCHHNNAENHDIFPQEH